MAELIEVGRSILLTGDTRALLDVMPDQSINCCVTSPPYYGLRDYGVTGQIGLEATPQEYIDAMVGVFREVRRVLRDDGTLWLNIGDSYCAPNGRSSSGKSYHMGPNSALSHLSERQEAGIKRRFGDTKPKDLIGIPWMLAFALRADGWYLRQDIIWHKPNPMPESVRDRCTKAHEYIFLLSKSERYYFDGDAIAQPLKESSKQRFAQPNLPNQVGSDRVPGKTNGNMKAVGPRFGGNKYGDDESEQSRTKSGNEWNGGEGKANKRSVWTVTTKPFKGAHFATFPPDLIEPCILAGSPAGGVVLDPFGGAGTTGLVCNRLGRSSVLIDLNPEYVALAAQRLAADGTRTHTRG